MGYIHTKEYYSALNKWYADICYKMDEMWKHYAKWKPDRKAHISYDSIFFLKYQE